MKSIYSKQINARRKRMILTSLGLLTAAVSFGSAHAKTINVETGPIFNQFFANVQCEQLASKYKGEWHGRYWTKAGTTIGVCQIDVPDTPSFTAHTISGGGPLISVDAGQLWNESHANWRCPQLAKERGGHWTGKWSEKTATAPSYCQITMTPAPVVHTPKYKKVHVKAGRIWSQEHAKKRCSKVAARNNGQWTGKWSSKDNQSTCQIKMAANATPVPAKKRNIREISAGTIWDQAQAKRRCPKIAKQAHGKWTGQWRKTGNNNEAVCEIKLQPLARTQAPVKPAPAPTPATSHNSREVNAGPIWDQAQANRKCPLIASQAKGNWTGKWRKLNYSTHQSVCEVSFAHAATTPVPTKTVVTTHTTYVNLPPAKSQNTREIYAGPIWDTAQAQTKCPLIAAKNQGTWTGKWRKTGPDHSSLCEVRF